MRNESFIAAIFNLLPDCKKQAIPIWVDFAAECVDSEQFVDFAPTKDRTVAIEKWLSSIYAGFYFVKKEFGESIASQICNLSLMGCLYPDQMKPAAEYLQNGGDFDKAAQLAVDGVFDGPPPFFPRLDDVLEDMNFWSGQNSEQKEKSIMNFFENELRKLIDHESAICDKKFVGRACFGRLSDNLRVRMEFVTQGTADHYEAIKATIINKNDGPVDSLTLRFSDLFGKKAVNNPNFRDGIVPYIWKYGDKTEWYVYQPTEADYKKISQALNDYLDVFRDPALGMKQSDHTENGPTMHSM